MTVQSQQADVAAYFDSHHGEWQRAYDSDADDGYVFRTRLDFAMELCRRHVLSPGRALDLGCGCGPAAIELARMGHHVLGVDLSESMIRRGRENAERAGVTSYCDFRAADFHSLDLGEHRFDVIVALGFIEYFDDPVPVLERMRSVLADSGVIVIQTPNRYRLRFLLQGRIGGPIMETSSGLRNRQYTPGQFARLAKSAGLTRVDHRGHGFGPLKIAGRFIPGYRSAHWLERRLDDVARHHITRAIGHVGACTLSVLRKR